MELGSMDRRRFVLASGGTAAALWLTQWSDVEAAAAAAHAEAGTPLAGYAWSVLTPAQAEAMDAFASRIIPTDELPGAREAGAVFFMDRALMGWGKDMKMPVALLAGRLDAEAAKRTPGVTFAKLPPAVQDEIVADAEKNAAEIFGACRFLVLCGTFAIPDYGGNKNTVGYTILGFEHRAAWTKPYGWYDSKEGLKNGR